MLVDKVENSVDNRKTRVCFVDNLLKYPLSAFLCKLIQD